MTDGTPVIGLLMPDFPGQTDCAWWRVGQAMRGFGLELQMLSTRRPAGEVSCHDFLVAESKQTHYCWPPAWGAVVRTWVRHPSAFFRGFAYLAGLKESNALEKLKLAPLLAAAADLKDYARRRGIEAIFVHSCANAAHLAAMCNEMGGPRYALRLGGDLDVYGKDHASKMRRAAFVASAAPAYIPEVVRRAGLPEQRIMWTWVGVDLEKFTPGDRSWERQRPDELQVVTVARLNRGKGHEDVLQAIALLRDRTIGVRWHVIGAGPHEQALRTRVDELGLSDRVELCGATGTDDVIAHLRRADVAVLASHGKGEAAPAFVCEAMACGVPVICTRIGATQEMMTDGVEGFLVPQHDPGAIADSLARMAEDESLRQAMARAAHQRSGVFDCRLVAERVLSHLGIGATSLAEQCAPAPDVGSGRHRRAALQDRQVRGAIVDQ